MRDIIIVSIYAAALGWAIYKKSPFIALMVYFWISFMNPHRYTWGFAYNLPLAMGAAAVTFLILAIAYKQIKFPRTRETYFFLAIWAFTLLTTIFSMYPEEAWPRWIILAKSFLMILVAMLIINNKDRIITFLLGVVFFIGLVGVKGAIFGVLTGGEYRVWGPPESFIEDNNSVGLCMVMLIPLCLFLKDVVPKKWQSTTLFGIAGALSVSAVLTYSRGALLGLVAVSIYYWTFSRHKIRVAAVGIIVLIIALQVLPQKWFNRMDTIEDYEEDRSANMRLNSWTMSYYIARKNILGGGFACFTLENYDRFSPNPGLGRAHQDGQIVGSTAHSIYFQVLATQGFGGLLLYLTALFSMLFSLRRVDRIGKMVESGQWVSSVSRGLIGSIIGFMASGAFLSLAFFDLFWALYGAGICLKSFVFSGEWLQDDKKILFDK
ncbi:MAG: putative O-glycosylation ligase, exosortase A system-associated [Actinobacteria bacterium]|nr:putative O-glycosylation ligase, exosortase A system-associated [Actinomycetota bacterium]